MSILFKPVILSFVFGVYSSIAAPVLAQEGGSICEDLIASYNARVAAGEGTKYTLISLEANSCEVPGRSEPSAPPVAVEPTLTQEVEVEPETEPTPMEEPISEPPVMVEETAPPEPQPQASTDGFEARIALLERELSAQTRGVAANRAAVARLANGAQATPEIQASVDALSQQITALQAENTALKSDMAALGRGADQSELPAQMAALQQRLDRNLALANDRIDSLMLVQARYETMVSNYLDSEVVNLVASLGAGACTRVSVAMDPNDQGTIIVAGSVWNDDLRRAILDIPLLSFFRVDNQLESGAIGIGCTEDLGNFQIVLDPETADPLLADKAAAIQASTSLPSTEACGQLISETSAIRHRFAAQPRGFWVRDGEGFVVACIASTQRPFILKMATGRRDQFYILVLGDLS